MQDIELAVVSQGGARAFSQPAGKAGLMQCNNTA
jgi:hypothetical protein